MGMPKARNADSRNTSNMPHLVELHKKCLANMRQHTGVPKQVNLRRDSAAAEARDSGQCSCLRLSVFFGRGPTETSEAVGTLDWGKASKTCRDKDTAQHHKQLPQCEFIICTIV